MTEELKQLRVIVSTSLDTIIDICESRGEEFPKLGDPTSSSEFSSGSIRNDPALSDAISFGISAAMQIAVTLQSPAVSLYNAASKVRCIFARVL